MLNGRVYGSRRQSEAAEREKQRREQEEPAFVEWGHGKAGGGMGSHAPPKSGGGFLADDDDGGGMSWVKRRREEREKREREAREQAEKQAGSSEVEQPSAESPSPPDQGKTLSLLTPNLNATPPPPAIHISSPVQPSPSKLDEQAVRRDQTEGRTQAINEHIVKAINIQPQRSSATTDTFDDGNSSSHRGRSDSVGEGGGDEEDVGEEEEEEEDDEEDDGDFEEDPEDLEEEKLNEAARYVVDLILLPINLSNERQVLTIALGQHRLLQELRL